MNIWKSEAGHDQRTFIRCLSNLLPCTKCLLSIWKGGSKHLDMSYKPLSKLPYKTGTNDGCFK